MTETTPHNLLTDPWLPVRLRDGGRDTIRLAELGRDDIVDIEAPRADFRGAIYQLLIGLLQTAFAPADRKAWTQYWNHPPGTDALAQAFAPYEAAFNIDAPTGEPAFMQDLKLPEAKKKGIADLLIETPGDKTTKENRDHFVKRGGTNQISSISASIALFTLQVNAPAGGRGHQVSLRGGGPLTTLLMPSAGSRHDSLWHRLWLNVLTHEEFRRLPGDHDNEVLASTLPWMGPTRTSEKKGMETFPEQANPLQAYWSMPRRIRLHFEEEQGTCDLTGEPASELVRHYVTKNYGINYAGHWIHPLTPYRFENNNDSFPITAQPGGLGYRHWLGLVLPRKDGKLVRTPATVVSAYEARKEWIGDLEFHPRLWAFGYDFVPGKDTVRCWYEAEMPVFNLDPEDREELTDQVQKMIAAATDVLKTLKASLKKAWFDRPGDVKGDMSFIDDNFWAATEPDFYALLGDLVAVLNDEDRIDELLGRWRNTLKQAAIELFDQYALGSLNEDGDLERVVKARDGKSGLQHYLNGSKA